MAWEPQRDERVAVECSLKLERFHLQLTDKSLLYSKPKKWYSQLGDIETVCVERSRIEEVKLVRYRAHLYLLASLTPLIFQIASGSIDLTNANRLISAVVFFGVLFLLTLLGTPAVELHFSDDRRRHRIPPLRVFNWGSRRAITKAIRDTHALLSGNKIGTDEAIKGGE